MLIAEPELAARVHARTPQHEVQKLEIGPAVGRRVQGTSAARVAAMTYPAVVCEENGLTPDQRVIAERTVVRAILRRGGIRRRCAGEIRQQQIDQRSQPGRTAFPGGLADGPAAADPDRERRHHERSRDS